jgi:hypothetical protein
LTVVKSWDNMSQERKNIMVPKIRKHLYISDDLDQRLKSIGDTLGLSYSAIVTMALQAGIASISIATNPDLKPYFEAELKKVEVKNAKTDRNTRAK